MLNLPDSYELISEKELSDIGSFGFLLKHKKSGARVFIVSNDDENKVFSIGFRTPVSNSTGVPHIIEHSVLCGSKKYPVKDPFVELVKGSLNTFLNAMTYPDKTVYPVASCNDADYANLMDVYLDAVFFPRIYDCPEIFLQEGWHYEMENEDSPLTINGVVYNEMKGVFSSPDQILARLVQKALFPETTYGYESGGEPVVIPELSYDEFLQFHRTYYHPSNSYIYMYGNMDVSERLSYMDREYLSKFTKIEADSEIKRQPAFEQMKYVTEPYSAQSEDEKASLSYNCVIDTSLNSMYVIAFQVLAYALVQVPGAPVKKALMDSGIGEEIDCNFDCELFQPVFSIDAKEADYERRDEFVKIIRDTLAGVCEEGIDKASLYAAIAGFEFRYREGDFGRYPKGLMMGLSCMQTWLYDDSNPYQTMCLNDVYKKLKELVDTDYFEKLIKEYLIDNTHSAVVCVVPEIGLSKRVNDELMNKLARYKEGLPKERIDEIINTTSHLRIYQEMQDSEEDLKKIPLLSVDDIQKEATRINLTEKECMSTPVVHSNIRTNGIAYVIMSYDIKEYKEYVQYINLLTYILTYVDTKKYDYLSLSNEINLRTGGVTAGVNISDKEDGKDYNARCEIVFSALYDELSAGFGILNEVIYNSVISDKKRIKEIISEARADIRARLEANGNATALDSAFSYLTELGYYQGMISSVGFYRFIDYLYRNFDECSDNLIEILESLIGVVFRRENLLISVTADEEGYEAFEKAYALFDGSAPAKKDICEPAAMLDYRVPEMGVYNEGFKTSGKVQYVVRAGRFVSEDRPFTGSLLVLKTILSYDYLWLKIRLQGGAYGAMSGFTRYGNAYFASYRDPKLKETNDVFEGVPEYIESFDCDTREITKYIIGTMSAVDAPMTPRTKGKTAFNWYLAGLTDEKRQKNRDEILATDAETIRGLAPYIRAALDDKCICVVGGAQKVEECRELFKEVRELL